MIKLREQLCSAVATSMSGGRANPPEAGRALWNAFQRLSATRTYHAGGANPIQPTEIRAWCDLMCMPLEARHTEILMAMDEVWLDRAYAKVKAPDGVKVLPPISKHSLSAGLLDAMVG